MSLRFSHIVLFWCAFALFITGVMVLVHPITNRPVDILDELVWEAAVAVCWIIGTPVTMQLARRFPVRKESRRNILVHFAAGLVLASLLCMLHGLILFLLQSVGPSLSINVFLTSLFYNIDKMLLVYTALVVMEHASQYYKRSRENEIAARTLESQLATAQMKALRMQVQPHFLFNTLNAVVSLVHKDPDKAEEMVVRLSGFLRQTLDSSAQQTIPLQEELAFITSYLKIEEVRFEGRFRFQREVPEDLLTVPVPMLILQPLVENAVKHGFSKYDRPGLLTIAAALEGRMLVLSVTDDAAPSDALNGITTGIGLTNVRERLTTMYGPSASMHLTPAPGRGVIVTLRFPLASEAV